LDLLDEDGDVLIELADDLLRAEDDDDGAADELGAVDAELVVD
jgi:hypothetical protein